MNNKKGPQRTFGLNSVVDSRSVFVRLKILDKDVEAVCDCGASVSCLSSEIYNELKKTYQITLETCTRSLRAANGLPIDVEGTIRVPVYLGNKLFHHEFRVLKKSEADCLLGLDFLERHKCDPLFSRMELKLESTHSVPLYHKNFEIDHNAIFRVVATETINVPAGHATILPAHIPNWKRPPFHLNAVFEPLEKFNMSEDISAPNILFDFSDDTIPVIMTNTTDSEITIYKNTTLGSSEFVSDEIINNVSRPLPAPSVPPAEGSVQNRTDSSKYDLQTVITSVDPTIHRQYHQQFAALVKEFKHVFSSSEWDLGKCDATSHKIDVYPGSKPIKIPNRRMPLHYKEDLHSKLDVFLEKELIAPCHSPYSSPAMLVPKKNGKLRLVIDYRQLNKQTVKSSWPIPSIEEIFDTLGGSCYFSTIDMSAGFYQVPMDRDSQDYTAFSTPFGSFKWLRMPMGLTGSPNTFQSLMEHVLTGLTWKTCVPYLDDCIIFSTTPEEHLSRLRQVFQRFQQANLKINPSKCAFFQTKVQFLGHIVSKDGLQVDPEKINAVLKFPTPTNQTHVKSFLGLASYYRRYVKDFAEIARPLHKASETSSEFQWNDAAQNSFDSLKHRLTTTPILAYPSLQKPFVLYTDASQFAMGAVLAQEQNGLERAVCYASKALSKTQSKYSATRRELLAIVTFTRHFRHYLLGRKFTIVTDHRALQWLHNFKDPDGITARWLEKLAPFDYDVRHRPGKSIGHADGLSRIPSSVNAVVETNNPSFPFEEHLGPDDSPNHQTQVNDDSYYSDQHHIDSPMTNATTQQQDEAIGIYREAVGNLFDTHDSFGHCVSADFKMSAGIARKIRRNYPCTYPTGWNHITNPLWPQWLPESKRYIYHLVTKQKFYQKPTYGTLRASLERMRSHAEQHHVYKISLPCIGSGLDKLEWEQVRQLIQEVFRTSPVHITVFLKTPVDPKENDCNSDFNDNALVQAQEADESLHQVRKWIRQSRVPRNDELQGLPRLGWQMFNQLTSLHIKNNVLCRKFEPLDGNLPFLQRIIPRSMVPEILTALHSSKTAGHLGTHKVIEKVRQRFYWPGFKEDVKQFIQCCDVCQKKSGPPKTHRHSLVDWKISYPFHHIGLDFLGPLPLSNGNRFILVIGDHFTKWYEAIPLPDQQASTTADALLEHWICRFGCPNSIHTDQGRNFESALFQRLMTLLEINKTRTTSFHPQSNSVIERMNRTLLNMLTKSIDKQQANWSHFLPFVLMAYRSSVHESTGFTPNRLVLGHEVLLPLDLMYPPPESHLPTNINEYVMTQQQKFHRAFELVRRNTTAQQRRRNALYNRKVHGPTYKEADFVLLHYDVTVPGQSPKLSSPWRGPYRILKCINDVNYKIEELSTGKQQIVHYDRLKRYHGSPPPSTTIPTRPSPPGPAQPMNSQTSSKTVNHDDCVVSFLPPPTLFAPSPWFSHPLPTPTDNTPASNVPVDSHISPPISPSITASTLPYDLTPSSCSLPSQPSTPSRNTTSSNQPRTIPVTNSPPTKPPSSPVENIVRRAARELHSRSPSNKRTLRPSTVTQRKAQPLFRSRLPRDLMDFLSPRKQKTTKPSALSNQH